MHCEDIWHNHIFGNGEVNVLPSPYMNESGMGQLDGTNWWLNFFGLLDNIAGIIFNETSHILGKMLKCARNVRKLN